MTKIALDIDSNESGSGDSRLGRRGGGAPVGAWAGNSRFLLWMATTARKLYAGSVKWSEIAFRKLESRTDTLDCIVLRDCKKIFGGSARVCRNETDTERNSSRGKTDTTARRLKLTIVPTLTVKPGTYTSVRFDPMRQAGVSVEASRPVDIYVVSENDYPEFSQRHNVYTAKYPRQTQFKTSLYFGPDIRKKWYLIFENASGQAVAVHYEVYN
jgi:hypothetical protein